MSLAEIRQHLRYNFTVNVIDAGFFGFALGLASYVTVIPLFISTLTDSTVIIGLASAVHIIGWQFPQILTANYVSGLRRYKPMVMFMTFHERWPFFGLALAAFLLPSIGAFPALLLALLMICWQSFGGGFTGTAWQSMIGKIIPPNRRGLFFGMQGSLANLLSSFGAVIAGLLLGTLPYPSNFVACFALGGLSMMISMIFLGLARELASDVVREKPKRGIDALRDEALRLLRRDGNFRWFVVARFVSQFAAAAIAFYTIYAVRRFDASPETTGLLTGVFLLVQAFSSVLMGWLGDTWGHRRVFALGNVFMALSAGTAILAPDVGWMMVAFILAALFNSVNWTTVNAMTVEFGTMEERPFYIGLSNSLTAPATLFAPIIGGALADTVGFNGTFVMCAVAGLICAGILQFIICDPMSRKRKMAPAPAAD